MNKDEFLRRLEEALSGEVPASVIRDNLNYYADYLSQELGKGRTMDEIIEEIGEPNIVARTIIDSAEAAGETGDGYGSFEDASPRGDDRRSTYSQESYQNGSTPNIHYFDLNKWYWKLALVVAPVPCDLCCVQHYGRRVLSSDPVLWTDLNVPYYLLAC
ncbi:MAG: DUF1700 domain-containing protein [Pilosibacter sp.]